jgi:hypothetical protein
MRGMHAIGQNKGREISKHARLAATGCSEMGGRRQMVVETDRLRDKELDTRPCDTGAAM